VTSTTGAVGRRFEMSTVCEYFAVPDWYPSQGVTRTYTSSCLTNLEAARVTLVPPVLTDAPLTYQRYW
jgi:hypothetical protein